jgi:three-Cys-motif partner protein
MTEYREDPLDGQRSMIVGAWAEEKHDRLRKYIDASRAARRLYLGPQKAGATYIDPFCGPGRSNIRDTERFIDGGAVLAWKESVKSGTPFTEIHIGDLDTENVETCFKRLQALNAPVTKIYGPANETTPNITKVLNPWGLHLSFLDPFNLGTLDIGIIKSLSRLKRMDILVHVSASDLQRNLEKYRKKTVSNLDAFAPGWREKIESLPSRTEARGRIVEHWKSLIDAMDMHPSAYMELISGDKNQPLYWLAFISRNDLAEHLWNEVRRVTTQAELF